MKKMKKYLLMSSAAVLIGTLKVNFCVWGWFFLPCFFFIFQVLFSLKNNENVFMSVVCCSFEWRFKGYRFANCDHLLCLNDGESLTL